MTLLLPIITYLSHLGFLSIVAPIEIRVRGSAPVIYYLVLSEEDISANTSKFTHNTTAVLSWHMQNFVAINGQNLNYNTIDVDMRW